VETLELAVLSVKSVALRKMMRHCDRYLTAAVAVWARARTVAVWRLHLPGIITGHDCTIAATVE
jgi:hypothetical protein